MLKFLINKKLFILTTVFVCVAILAVVFLLPQTSLAQNDSFGLTYAQNVGLSTQDLRTSVVQIIRNILGVLGILALIIILYGGLVYMTSRGDSQKIELAKKILLNAVVGLIIIMMSFAIVSWILSVLSAGQGGGSGAVCTPYECSGCGRCNSTGDGYSSDNSCDNSCLGNLPSSYFSISDIQTSHGTAIAGSHDDNTNKSNVFWCSKIQTIFNHQLSPQSVLASVTSNKLRIAINDTANNASGDYTTRGNVLSFTPTNHKFDNLSTEHNSYLPNSLENTQDPPNFLSQCSLTASCDVAPPPTARWDFFVGTEGDSVNPSIIQTYPISDTQATNYPDTNVNLDPTIQVSFSEAIDWDDVSDNSGTHPNASNIMVRNLDSGQQLLNTMWDIQPQGNGFIMYLNNSNVLEGFTNYEITVQNIHDLCGNIMDPNPYVWQFSTNNVVPGINSHYPTGTNSCPSTLVSLSYNTSMYANQITFSIQSNLAGTQPSIYTLEPINGLVTTTNNIGGGSIPGTFTVVDQDLNNINNNYRVYEFTPQNDLDENTTYIISYTTDKVIDATGNTLSYNWDFAVTDLTSCVCTPYISHLNLDQGPVGACLTINGQCFTGTQTQPAIISNINFDTTNAVIGNGYTANAVGTTVPANFQDGNRPQINIAIDYTSNNTVPVSNSKEFTVTTGQATGPCLWSVNPNHGQPGVTSVSLSGLRFGDFLNNTIHQVTFANNQNFNVSQVTDWSDTKIQNVIVPVNTVDGDVMVTNQIGTSNAIPFDARYCGDNVVDPGEDCDGTNLNGKDCKDMGYLGGVLSCNTNCQFNNPGGCTNAPQVLENSSCVMSCDGGPNAELTCNDDNQCPGARCLIDQTPSPSPYKSSQEVCLNIGIQADFNTDILASTLNTTNIYLASCGSDSTCSGSLTPLVSNITSVTNRSFILTPASYLAPDSWYQGTITTGITNLAKVAMQENYVWRFKTKIDNALCPVEKVHVTPDNTDKASANTTYPYSVSATGPNCVVLQGNYDWAWSINEPVLGVAVTEDLSNDANATVLTSTEKGTTAVRAETEGKYDTGRLNINFDTCNSDIDCADPNGDGVSECPYSTCNVKLKRCTPIINSLDPAEGPTDRWVTLNGCHFKAARGTGHVDFGDTIVTTYPCNEVWQDSQIIVGVPQSLVLGTTPVTVTDLYNLTSPASSFKVTDECLTGVATPASGVPGVCSLNPNSGMPQTKVAIAGENFGNITDTVNFGVNLAANNSWTTQSISTLAPDTVTSGIVPVTVKVAQCPSNSLNFTYPSGGLNDSCDYNKNNFDANNQPICDPANNQCYPGLYCNASSCLCETAPKTNVITASQYPDPTSMCRNSVVQATFDDLVVDSSLDVQLWQKTVDATAPNATCITDLALLDKTNLTNHHKLAQLITVVKQWFYDLLSSVVQAQVQNTYWCPVDGALTVQDVAQGIESCDNTNGCTRFIFSPDEPLTANGNFNLHIKGGSTGAKTINGAELNTNNSGTVYYTDPSYSWSFSVGNEICQIASVKPDISFKVGATIITRHNATYDFYTCAGRDDCPDDSTSVPGNQHDYLAKAYDSTGVPLVAAYTWTEYDTANLIEVGPPQDVAQTFVTANPHNGKSIVRVEATDPNPADTIQYGSAITSINITNFLCANPWPTLTTFPFQDTGGNCDSGSGSCDDMTFSTFYCRDAGQDESFCLGGSNANQACAVSADCPAGSCVVSTADDLPAPITPDPLIRSASPGYCVGGSQHGQTCSNSSACDGGYCYHTLKEHMFTFQQGRCLQSATTCTSDADCAGADICKNINDLIGMRTYRNDEHLSPTAWYQKYANQPGSFVIKSYDDYEAIESGRTTYIGMAVDAGQLKSFPIYTDMFLVSYTDKSDASTINIHDQLLANLVFNTNGVDDVRMCSLSKAYCTKDSTCPDGEVCNANKTKLARDTIRMGHLNEMIYHLDLYRGYCSAHQNLACLADTGCPGYIAPGYPDEPASEFCIEKNSIYPLLEAGTYIPGESTSVWDSWNKTLASLLGASPLLDPLNEVYCDQNAGYNTECWNQENVNNQSYGPPAFSCDGRAHFYQYDVLSDGNSYNLNTMMEYSTTGWKPGVVIGNLTSNNSTGACYNLQYQR